MKAWMWITKDGTGDNAEGGLVAALLEDGRLFPLVTTVEKTAMGFAKIARLYAAKTGHPVELLEFYSVRVVDRIDPTLRVVKDVSSGGSGSAGG